MKAAPRAAEQGIGFVLVGLDAPPTADKAPADKPAAPKPPAPKKR